MALMYVGELAALSVSVCWSVSSSVFERSGKRVGSLSVNFLRLVVGFVMLGVYGLLINGSFLPQGAGYQQWFWLSLSGFLGFFIGDLFLFQSLTIIGSRLSMLVMTFAPAMTAILGALFLNEYLRFYQWLAILLTILGILIAFVGLEKGRFNFKMSLKGFLFALGGAMGQAMGLVASKKGMGDYDPFAATQIRVITGLIAFTLFIVVLKRWGGLRKALQDTKAVRDIAVGSFFGPFLGVALSMYAITKTETGVASALMALTPLVLIVPALVKGRRIARREWVGALVSVAGVMLLFL
jgi:drug/metabolite transporter (DMT)-like permease